MDFELDSDQRAWRDEVRAFLRENVTAGMMDHTTSDTLAIVSVGGR